ncbi:UvrD-helicase domain-containing protein [Caviibacter abscessus]|uniref:UvrD-helicase domain-containing protein n=1 Tax=Caviibacter abscessus TaxID=1766719 RepID=UPI000831120B|nr:UvrD-helicase domain-containing protein [Caviibacter abscessus]
MKAKIISASAGTGKTYTMALEFIKSLNNGISYDQILVITFTKKATFEIKERVLKFLKQIAFKEEGYEELVKNLKIDVDYSHLKNVYEIMIQNSENIRISTMDSFINKIFKNVIAPYKNLYKYEVVDTNSNEYLLNLLSNIMKDKRSLKIFKDFYDINPKVKKIENYTNDIKSILELKPFLYDLVNIELTVSEIKEYNFKYIKELLDDFLYRFKESYDLYSKVDVLFECKNEKQLFANISKNVLESKIIKKNEAANDYFKDNILPILCNFYYKQVIIKYNNIYRKFAKICYEFDEKNKFSSKSFTFNDITFFTKKYLYDKELNLINNKVATPMFLNILGGSIETMMIDEFQDTSYIQFYLFLPIIKTCKNLLIVGDEKQSIYGFRGGDKRLFINLDTILKNNISDIEIKKLNLNTCYRSKENIIKFVNDVFCNLNDFEYTNVNFIKPNGYVNASILDKTTELEPFVCDIIEKNNHYNNTAILFRNNKDIDNFSKELEIRNIKYQSIASNSIEKIKSVMAIYKLVHYLYSGNIYSLLEFLRSDLIGFNLKKIRDFLEDNNFTDIVIDNINKLKSNHKNFKKRYIKYFGYGINPSNEDILNINKFLDIIDSKNSLKEFLDYYDENSKNIKKENAIEDEGIKLLTIHKSKGLEFDNVYTFVKLKTNTYRDFTLVKEYDENFNLIEAIFIKKKDVIINLNHGKYYLNLYNKISYDDEINNMYVALTRAKSNMCVFVLDDSLNITTNKNYGELENFDIIESNDEEYHFTNSNFYLDTQYIEYDKKQNHSIVIEQKRKIGLAVHYFFQYLLNEKYEKYAYSMLLKKYGNLIGEKLLNIIKEKCIKYVKQNQDIFNEKYEVHTEFEIFNENNEKYIIDRINIDHKNKNIYIYDYKTIKEPDNIEKYKKQIENYKNIIESQYKGYNVNTKLLSINIF